MSGIYTDENGNYQIDLSRAICSTDSLHTKYQSIGNILSDVDWIAETADTVILIEFKNYATRERFPQGDDLGKLYQKIQKKYYGSVFYLLACGNNKLIDFVWVVESPHLDTVLRKRYFERIQKNLPFRFQRKPEIVVNLINTFGVLSVAEWNTNTDSKLKHIINPIAASDTFENAGRKRIKRNT